MTKLPTVNSRQLIKFLKKEGFVLLRQKGSHNFFKHLDGRIVMVPVHQGNDIGKGLLRKILNDMKISPQDFAKIL